MIQTVLIYAAMLGWVPVLMGVYAALPARRATVLGFVVAWLYLPMVAFDLPGLPDYTKVTATTVGAALACLAFDPRRIMRLRLRWYDLPLVGWCLSGLFSSMSNGLGVYDGLSNALSTIIMWGLPYLLGRAYLSDLDGMRQLAEGIVLGGMSYVPLCLLEIRLSPFLNSMVYGFSFWEGTRYGGFRPKVFLASGLELGMWMTASSLIAVWLWSSKAARPVLGIPYGLALAALLVTTVLCKSTGALALLLGGLGALWFCRLTRLTLAAWLLLLTPLLYCGTRSMGIWSGTQLVDVAASLTNADRAHSLEFRLNNEDILAAKAMQQPLLGWAGYGRARIFDENGRDISITDGYWIIVLGNNGLFGLFTLMGLLLLPPARFFRNYPARRWREPELAAPAAFAVLLCVYMVDNISNAMINPIYALAAGGLVALPANSRTRNRAGARDAAATVPAYRDDREILADNEERIGREMKHRGRDRDADRAWTRAWKLREELAREASTDAAAVERLAALGNDLAWLLATRGDAADSPRALDLAERAVAAIADRSGFWNTLAATRLRVGDHQGSLDALDRAASLGGETTGFDDMIRALALAHLDQHSEARLRFEAATVWMARFAPRHPDLIRFRSEAEQALGRRVRT